MDKLQAKQKIISERNVLIDNIKGLVVIIFLFSQVFIQSVTTHFLPRWFPHTGRNGGGIDFLNFSLIDLGPVAFFFVIGLVVFGSLSKKIEMNGKSAYRQYFIRNLAIVGLFALFTFVSDKIGNVHYTWNTLMSVGLTGLLLLPFLNWKIRNNTWLRLACALVIFVVYYFFNKGFIPIFDDKGAYVIGFVNKTPFNLLYAEEGGISACVGYLGVVLLASVFSDFMRKGLLHYSIATVAAIAFAVVVRLACGVAFYRRYNITYIVSAFAAVNAFYFVFFVINKFLLKNRPIPVLITLGRNLMLFIMLALILSAPFNLFRGAEFLSTIKGPLIMFVLYLAFFVILTVPLAKRKVLFKL
ncbi:MAG: hypothetical protein LBT30_06030 [Clostridiales bacterium]|jgi:hypothetical protein|nr:hypothetical protein [Clostridiales bacterium]